MRASKRRGVAFQSILGSLTLAAVCCLPATPAGADITWNVQSGDWSVPSNWNGGLPTSSSTADVFNGGTVNITQSGEVCSTLSLGGSSTGIVNMTAGGLSVSTSACVGYSGSGTFTQSGGTNTISSATYGLYLGYNSGSSGTYSLSGIGQLSANCEYVGCSGSGTFTQSGGYNQNAGLYLGSGSNGNGTYNLNGTGQLSANSEYVGNSGTGTFNQSGGTNTMVVGVLLGNLGTGTYNLSAGLLSANSDTIGGSGTGTFTQSGGTNQVTGHLYLGDVSGSSGKYNLNGGLLVVPSIVVGSGSATFNFGGGTLQASGSFTNLLPIALTGSGGNATVDTASYTVTLSGSLSGAGGLNKTDFGTLVLAASNSYAGGTTVNGGVLVAPTPSALPGYSSTSTALAVNNGATLTLSVSGSGWSATNLSNLLTAHDGSFAPGSVLALDTTAATGGFSYGTIYGNMGLTKLGSNSLTLTGASTFSGNTVISGGTLQLGTGSSGSDGSLGNSPGINNNGVLLYDLSGTQTYGGIISGAGTLTKAGGGVLALTGSNIYTGPTTISAGTLQLGNGTSGCDGSLAAAGGITDNAALVYNLYGPESYAGSITGTGSLTKTGPGTLTLTGTNAYTGSTIVSGGVLAVTSTSALPCFSNTSTLTVNNGGMLTLSVGGSGWTAGNINNLLNYHTGSFASGTSLGMDTTLAGTGGFTYGTAISGSMGLTVVGPYALILTGTNTYTGGTTITGGVLQLGIATSGSDGSITGPITDNGWLVYDLAGSQTCSGAISGSGGLEKYGSNTLVLTGSNTFSSATYVMAGTLTLANSAALQGSVYSGGGGALVFSSSVSGHAFTFGGLYGSNNLKLQDSAGNPVALSTNNNVSTVYSGVLSGSGSLTMTGSNSVLTLTGVNTYTGGTTISGGTLQLGEGTSGDDGSLSNSGGINNNAALIYNLYGSQTYGGVISGTGTLTKAGGGMLSLTGASSFSGATILTGGALQLGDGSLFNTSGITDDAALVCNINGSQTYAGVINGSGSLTKAGSGSLTLSSSSTFSGPTTISGGSLVLANGNALESSTVAATTTGSIVFANSGAYTFGALSGSGNLSLQSGTAAIALTVGGNNASTTYSGGLSGSGSLVTAGNGTLTFTGSNTCNGGVTLGGGGGLALVSAASLSITPTSGNLYVGNTGPAALTIADSASVNVGGQLDVNCQYTGTGPSTLTLTGGALHVAGPTYIGCASMFTGPANTSAAVYQSGGTATLTGPVAVGYNGTATSIYDINGGVLNANGGLSVGGSPAGGQGNGVMEIQGSAVVSVSGGSGLVVGQDSTLATSGSLDLSSGTLSVVGNVTLGISTTQATGGIGVLSRSGGVMTVSGNLAILGNAAIILDGTTGNVTTTFSGGLSRTSPGTLVVVPETGNFNTSEALLFGAQVGLTDNIIGAWAVVEASGTNTSGSYLTTTATTLGGHTYYQLTTLSGSNYDTNFSQPTSSVVENVTLAVSPTGNPVVYAMMTSGTTTLGSSSTLTLNSGGLILNGGMVSGGTLLFGPNGQQPALPLIYAGTNIPGTINSDIQSSRGLVKFGPGTLVLAASNSGLSGDVYVNSGTLAAQNSGALGVGGVGSPTIVAAGALWRCKTMSPWATCRSRSTALGQAAGRCKTFRATIPWAARSR